MLHGRNRSSVCSPRDTSNRSACSNNLLAIYSVLIAHYLRACDWWKIIMWHGGMAQASVRQGTPATGLDAIGIPAHNLQACMSMTGRNVCVSYLCE